MKKAKTTLTRFLSLLTTVCMVMTFFTFVPLTVSANPPHAPNVDAPLLNWTRGYGVSFVAVGAEHTVAIRGDGTLWAWGRNNGGQLGIGVGTHNATGADIISRNNPSHVACSLASCPCHTPTDPPTPPGSERPNCQDRTWKHVSAGVTHTVAIKNDGS
jgi:alpha-tubulin suppressor-like RCC1 family protein